MGIIKIDQLLGCIRNAPSESFESETIEFKEYKDTSALHNASKELVAEITAFSNKSGGTIIVGVKDSSNVKGEAWETQLVGIEEVDCDEARKRIAGNLNPKLAIVLNNHQFEGLNFLIIDVPCGFSQLAMTSGGKCYIRSGRDSVPMSPDDVKHKILSNPSYDWSADLLFDLNPEDVLDQDQVDEALEEYVQSLEIGSSKPPREFFLEIIGVLSNGVLTKAGLLFLGKPEYIYSQISNVEYRFSKRENGGQLVINEVWSSSLWGALKKTRALLSAVQKYCEFKCDGKIYKFANICTDAFEEALVNSFVHRDYSVDGMNTIEFEPGFVTLVNPGDFYGGVTASNIFTHPPRQRNKALAQIFMKFGWVDRAGMGTRRMNIQSLRLGREMPKFRAENNCVYATLELEKIKEGILIVTMPFEDYGVVELFLINSLYGKGVEDIKVAINRMGDVSIDPRRETMSAIARVKPLIMVGNNEGVYVTVDDSYREILNAYQTVQKTDDSDLLVAAYSYLSDKDHSSSNELASELNIGNPKQISQALKKTKSFVFNQENGVDYWCLAKA